MVVFQTMGLTELLGDARLHGFQAGSELRALEGELTLLPRKGIPRVLGSRFTLVGYRTLTRELPHHQRSLGDALGWGMLAQVETLRERAIPYRATVQAEALVVVDQGPRFRHFTALGAGAKAGMHWGAEVLAPVLGPRLSLSHRTGLFGALTNAVRLEAEYAPFWRVGHGITHEAAGSLQVDLQVARFGHRRLLFTPRAQARWEGRLTSRIESALERRLTVGFELH